MSTLADDRFAARQDALALITAEYHQIPGLTLPIMSEWLSSDLQPDQRTTHLADQLLYWSCLLFTLACHAQGTDPLQTQLQVPFADRVRDDERADVMLALSAAQVTRLDLIDAVYRRRLFTGQRTEQVIVFLTLLVQLAAVLTQAAAPSHPEHEGAALLRHLGATSATPTLRRP